MIGLEAVLLSNTCDRAKSSFNLFSAVLLSFYSVLLLILCAPVLHLWSGCILKKSEFLCHEFVTETFTILHLNQ